MSDKELEELQNPDNWDWESAQRVTVPSEHKRSVVSVSLPRDQSRLIAEAAERAGERVSAFIRNAAMERATGKQHKITVRFDPEVISAASPENILNPRLLHMRGQRSGDYSLT
jgi:hypothetical protein